MMLSVQLCLVFSDSTDQFSSHFPILYGFYQFFYAPTSATLTVSNHLVFLEILFSFTTDLSSNHSKLTNILGKKIEEVIKGEEKTIL